MVMGNEKHTFSFIDLWFVLSKYFTVRILKDVTPHFSVLEIKSI